MLYTELTRKAMKIAYDAHHGQTDKGGVPYIFHPVHLAEQMPDEVTTCIALLHDVVEDTPVTIEELEAQFPGEVAEALRLLTHTEHYSYGEYIAYIKEIAKNKNAVTVKIADLRHNMDESRVVGTSASEEEKARRRKKYSDSLEILENPPA